MLLINISQKCIYVLNGNLNPSSGSELASLPTWPECLISRTGDEYKGQQNLTGSGQVCLTWMDVPEEAISSLGLSNDTVPSEAQNYCRNPSNSTSSYVGCFYDSASGAAWESCLVPYCGEYWVSVVQYLGDPISTSLLIIHNFLCSWKRYVR